MNKNVKFNLRKAYLLILFIFYYIYFFCRHAYLTVLKICKLILCTIGHILYIIAENNIQQQQQGNTNSSLNNSTNNTTLLKEALCNIPSPTTEIITRNVASKLARAYLEKVRFNL